jgi:two-component system NarL family sensor kinase
MFQNNKNDSSDDRDNSGKQFPTLNIGLPRTPWQFSLLIVVTALVPLLVAVAAMRWVVDTSAQALVETQVVKTEAIWMDALKDELKHFVEVTVKSVRHVVASNPGDPSAMAARNLVRRMDAGEDAYIFIYTLDGRSVVHPRLPGLEGKLITAAAEPQLGPIIERLLAEAKNPQDGGFVKYDWARPSTGKSERKLGYVTVIPELGWMVGTGLYLEPLQKTSDQIRATAHSAINDTLNKVWLIALLAVGGVFAGLAYLNVHKQMEASQRIQALLGKLETARETERQEVSMLLHDDTMSLLYTVRLKVLKVMRESAKGHDQGHLISTQLPEIVQLVDQASDMVRDTSHKLHPIMLNESDGLSIVLREAVREFRERSGVATQVSVEGAGIALPLELANATFRVVEEALRNIEKHAQAHQVWLEMSVSLSDGLDLRLRDDGIGFSTSQYTRSSGRQKGLGMTNMHQRIQKNGGRLVVSSSQVPGESGTVLTIHFSGARLMQKDSA